MRASGTSTALLMAYEKVRKPVSAGQKWVDVVTGLSTGAIIMSHLARDRSLLIAKIFKNESLKFVERCLVLKK